MPPFMSKQPGPKARSPSIRHGIVGSVPTGHTVSECARNDSGAASAAVPMPGNVSDQMVALGMLDDLDVRAEGGEIGGQARRERPQRDGVAGRGLHGDVLTEA